MKKSVSSQENKGFQSHCFSLHGSQMYFSPLTPPCCVPSMQTLGSNDSLRACCFRCREALSPTSGLSEMWRRVIPASLVCHICQLPSAEPVSQHDPFFMPNPTELAYFLSSSRCHCYLYCSIHWKNTGVQLCLKQLFGEENIGLCIGKWCLASPFHRPPGIEWLK